VALCKSAFYVAVHNYYHRAFHGAPVLRAARVGDRTGSSHSREFCGRERRKAPT